MLLFGLQALDVNQQLMIIVSVMQLEVGRLILMEFLLNVTQLLILLESKELLLTKMNVGERLLESQQLNISPLTRQLPLLMKLQNL